MKDETSEDSASKKATRLLGSVGQSVLSGVVLAILFFVSREIWFPLPDVAGRWTVETHTTKTDYVPYQDMTVTYVAILWREGANVKGTIEKVSEVTQTGTTTYTGDQRTRGVIEGHIDKLYLSGDRIALHVIEEGSTRQSSSFHALAIEEEDQLTGTFVSTAADSEGTVVWRRTQAR